MQLDGGRPFGKQSEQDYADKYVYYSRKIDSSVYAYVVDSEEPGREAACYGPKGVHGVWNSGMVSDPTREGRKIFYKRRQCAAHKGSWYYKDNEGCDEVDRLEPCPVNAVSGRRSERQVYFTGGGEYKGREEAVQSEDYLYRRIDPERRTVPVNDPSENNGAEGKPCHEYAQDCGYRKLGGAE